MFSLKVQPEEEIVPIAATKEVSEAVCLKIQAEFEKNCKLSGAIYILPIERIKEEKKME